MNKETMKQGMIKVLNMYDIPWVIQPLTKLSTHGQITRHL